MIVAIIVASTVSSGVLMPRFGPRPLIPAGLLLGAGGLVILATQLSLHTSYLGQILAALLLVGVGLGMVFGCALNTATYGAGPADAGVASALVNTCQQVGGSIGTALLNTIAASALTSYVLAHGRSPLVLGRSGGAQLRGRVLGLGRDPGRLRGRLRAGAGIRHARARRPGRRPGRRLTRRR
jgi:MFS family permease